LVETTIKRIMVSRYFKEYQWSNIAAMIKNNRRDPRVCTNDFKDRLVVISGATSGIGYHTAKKFASHRARLLCINRDEKKSEALKAEIEKEYGVSCEYIIADLGNLKDIFSAAEKLGRSISRSMC